MTGELEYTSNWTLPEESSMVTRKLESPLGSAMDGFLMKPISKS